MADKVALYYKEQGLNHLKTSQPFWLQLFHSPPQPIVISSFRSNILDGIAKILETQIALSIFSATKIWRMNVQRAAAAAVLKEALAQVVLYRISCCLLYVVSSLTILRRSRNSDLT